MSDRCLVLGGGVSGRAAARLAKLIGMTPEIVCDAPGLDAAQVAANGYALAVASPGVKPLVSPLYQAVKARADNGDYELLSEMEFAFRHMPQPRRLLAITGTNGKTTTTELTVHLLKACGVAAVPAGNIGFPLADTVADMLEHKLGGDALPVVEVSSFQLERTGTFSPFAAALLNLESDHEDRYAGGFAEYCAVKRSIFDRVADENRVYGLAMTSEKNLRRVTVAGDVLYFDGKPLIELRLTHLNPPHNRENLAAAVELAARILPPEVIFSRTFSEAVKSFSPGRHRIETVATGRGVRFVDDSKATNPASVVAAVRSLEPGEKAVILLGGLDKGMDFSPLAGLAGSFRAAILFGECRAKIAAALDGKCKLIDCGMDFALAVKTAAGEAQSGDVVLLSPACASMDMFKNYAERGERFAELARAVLAK
ncbi:MAG: UDP-N-acetylmuramoyl-L-alanine--D-glutamate ligase [Victivallaceae bacterium]|nr:UDP-N-acetylmuramoyl-L-alanine--D-glutamate ligase [Victivallaceae bacterium]